MAISVLSAALKLAVAGVSVIPIKVDGSKSPTIVWKPFQTAIATPEQIAELFSAHVGIAALAGAVSGNLEIVDIESGAPQSELVDLIDEHLPGFLPTLPQVLTPSGGRHIFYRCERIAGNQKLALDAEHHVLIETRGEGGYVVTVSSPPECHASGKPYIRANGSLLAIPTITIEQRDVLLACCRSFNRLVRDDQRPVQADAALDAGVRPGDDYNVRGDALSVLLKHGWTITGRHNGTAYLARPGKKSGISASFGHVRPNCLYVFSSNAAPFDFERLYDAFRVYAELECNGDLSEAGRRLRKDGYGEQPKPVVAPKREPDPEPEPVESGLIYETMTVTEDHVARIFEEKYRNELRYCDAWGRWLKWNLQQWEPEHTLLAFHYCREIARLVNREMKTGPAKASFARGVESFCRASRTFATVTGEWDRNAWLLNLPEATMDLKTGNAKPHDRSDYITKCGRIMPRSSPMPIFDRFLRDITLEDESLANYLQRSLGACLSGALTDNFLLFWYGTGQNGKNTLGDLVTWILGDYAKVIPIETLISTKSGSHPTILANLRGLRLAVCSEVSEGSYWDESRVKSLTGDTDISARFMRQDFFEFSRTHKHLVYGNHRPMLRIVDRAMRSRLHIVPFKAHFPPSARDPDMPAKLRTEAPQILKWLIEGHASWLEDGYLKKCSAVQAETDNYFDAQSTPEMWLDECCVVQADERIQAKYLYGSFKEWKESRGEGVMSATRWGEWMQRFDKKRIGGVFWYIGIGLRAPVMTQNAYQ